LSVKVFGLVGSVLKLFVKLKSVVFTASSGTVSYFMIT
jgi:hypothetical protein